MGQPGRRGYVDATNEPGPTEDGPLPEEGKP